jgi:hypothetical protein
MMKMNVAIVNTLDIVCSIIKYRCFSRLGDNRLGDEVLQLISASLLSNTNLTELK